MKGLKKGLDNLQRHLINLAAFGQTTVVAFNKFHNDSAEEIAVVRDFCERKGVRFALCEAFEKGGAGAVELANVVVDAVENSPSGRLLFTYEDDDPIDQKLEKVAMGIYGAQRSFVWRKGAKNAQANRRNCSRKTACVHCQNTIFVLGRSKRLMA